MIFFFLFPSWVKSGLGSKFQWNQNLSISSDVFTATGSHENHLPPHFQNEILPLGSQEVSRISIKPELITDFLNANLHKVL